MSPVSRGVAEQLSGHRPYLVRFASRHLRDAAQVQDMVQETLLAALQGAERFENKASVRTWLTAILLRRIADTLRQHHRRPMVAADNHARHGDAGGGGFDDDESAAAEPIDWVDPQRRLESRQALAALAQRLAALPPIAARVLALREFEGLSNEAAARELGLTPHHSAVLLHRARNRLRAELAPATPDSKPAAPALA